MIIRRATIDDLDEIHYVESECFSKSEAASKKEFEDRLSITPIISGYFLMMIN